MPFVDIDKNKQNAQNSPYPSLDDTPLNENVGSPVNENTTSTANVDKLNENKSNVPTTDSSVVERVDMDGVRSISKPFGNGPEVNEAVQTNPSLEKEKVSSTVYPPLDSMKQAQEVAPTEEKANKEPDLSHVEKFEQLKSQKDSEPEVKVLNNKSMDINQYLDVAVKKNASDVHFTVGYPVYYRVDGALQKAGVEKFGAKEVSDLLVSILNDKQREDLNAKLEVDMVYQHSTGNRFRVNIFYESGNLTGAFRLIPKKIKTVEELSLPAILKEFSKIPYGLVVVTGPTGSGKSTTIAAMIEEINRNEAKHIITIEDPVEYVFEKKMSLIDQRNMYEDTQSWQKALRSVLRQDPNVVLVGEMRDYETIASAMTVAETGHLVFATLHTNSAAQTIDRIIDVFPEGQQNQIRSQLSNMLSGVISQRLLPLKGGGRKAAVEILIATVAVKNAIRERKVHQIDNIIQTSSDIGMISLEKSLVNLIREGSIDVQTAKDFSAKPDEIDLLMR